MIVDLSYHSVFTLLWFILVEVNEEHLTSHIYIVGKGKYFNCLFEIIVDILWYHNQTQQVVVFLKTNCTVESETMSNFHCFDFFHIKICFGTVLHFEWLFTHSTILTLCIFLLENIFWYNTESTGKNKQARKAVWQKKESKWRDNLLNEKKYLQII